MTTLTRPTGRLAAAVAIAIALGACAPAPTAPPVGPTPSPVGSPSSAPPSSAAPTTIATPAATVEAEPLPVDPEAAPMAFAHVPDADPLHGMAVGNSPLIRLPDGTFLLLRREDSEGGGVLLHSDDGIAWTAEPDGVPGTRGTRIMGIAATGRAVVAWGDDPSRHGAAGDAWTGIVLWRSTDGRAWDLAHPLVLPNVDGWSLLAMRGRFLFLRSGLEVLVGDVDGATWTPAKLPGAARGESLVDVAATADGFMAVGSHITSDGGDEGIGWVSSDGLAWSRLPWTVPGVAFGSVASAGDRVVASATETTLTETSETHTPFLYESVDGGRSWTQSAIPLDGADGAGVMAIPGGILLTVEGPRFDSPTFTWFTDGRGPWVPVTLEATGLDEKTPPFYAAGTPDHIVLASATLGTGGRGDRVVLWTYDAP